MSSDMNPNNPNNLTSALPPPDGGQSNFTDPSSLWKWDVLCVAMCLTFSTIPFILRCFVRKMIKNEWLWEDWMVVISWVGLVAYCAVMTTVMNRNGGIHEYDLTVPQVHEALYWFNCASIVYGVSVVMTKLTILMLYRRVFVPQRWCAFDCVLRAFEAIILSFYVAITIVKIFECTPRPKIWNKTIPGHCVDVSMLLNASGLFNTVTDIGILLVPIKSVWNLRMSKRKKMLVVSVFTVGSIAPVFSLIGFVVRLKIASNPDTTYYQPEILLWGCAEVTTGLICSCLPPLSVLFNLGSRRKGPHGTGSNTISSREKSRNSGAITLSRKRVQLSGGDEELLSGSGDFLELVGWNGAAYGLERPVGAVCTSSGRGEDDKSWKDGLDGGSSEEVMWQAQGVSRESVDHDRITPKIVKTVEIQQTFE